MLIVKQAALNKFLKALHEELTPLEAELYLFGSFARKTHKPDSDVDLLIIINQDYHGSIRDQINDFLLETGVLISPVLISPEQFNKVKHLKFYDNIIKKGMKLGQGST